MWENALKNPYCLLCITHLNYDSKFFNVSVCTKKTDLKTMVSENFRE